jgi:hypothetical protein
MRRESTAEREAWTALIERRPAARANKYHAERTSGFASKHEATVAGKLVALERGGKISDLRYQVRLELVAGRDGVRGIVYVADFVWKDTDGHKHIGDAKGYKTATYRLKKRLALLLHGITIEEL